MNIETIGNPSVIISLDVDAYLFKRLERVMKAGFSVAEINTSDEKLLRKILEEFPSLRIGAGNVTTTQQLENCYQAGAHFVSSPGFLPAIAQTAAIYSINFLPGVATLSEAMQAMALGCHQARPYPASYNFCALLNKNLPMLRLFPAEIEWDEAEHYLSLPSVAAISILNPEIEQLKALSQTVSV